MATFVEISDKVVQAFGDRQEVAENMLAITQGLIGEVQSKLDVMIAAYTALGVTVTVTGVDTTYVAPTATAPTLPTASGVAIGDVDWDRIWARAAAKDLRASNAEEEAASSEAALRGMAVPVIVSNGFASISRQRAMDRVSANAEASALEQAKAAREDQISVAKLGIESFVGQWQAKAQSELARLQYERLELDKFLEPEKLRAEYTLKLTELAQANAMSTLVDLIQVCAQITNAAMSSSNAGLGSDANIQLSGAA